MKFREKLNEYMERLSCSAKDLCTLSGISAASFSRYKNGERVPEMGTVPFDKLCGAIAEIAGRGKQSYRSCSKGNVRRIFKHPAHDLGGKRRPRAVLDQSNRALLVIPLDQYLNKMPHRREYIGIAGGSCKNQFAIFADDADIVPTRLVRPIIFYVKRTELAE